MAIFASNLAPASTDRALGSAVIERSLRFNRSDDPQLQRTATTTSNTFTYSTWVKRSNLSTFQYLFSIGGQGLLFNTDDTIRVYTDGGANASTGKFRDTTSWYHVVLSMNSGSATVYVNNVTHLSSVSGFSLSTSTNYLKVGWLLGDPGQFNLDGYLAETQLIDGSALTPSSFGFTDSQTGMWMPKRYEGSYGTSGFRLDYSDNSSTSALGIDKSPNGNDFTVNNFSVSAGEGNDSVIDTPTKKFPTLNSLDKASTITLKSGNLQINTVINQNYDGVRATFGTKTGKYYWEIKIPSTGYLSAIGIARADGYIKTGSEPTYRIVLGLGSWYNTYNSGGVATYVNTTPSSDYPSVATWSGASNYSNNDVYMIAVDFDNGKMWWGKNNSWFNNSGTANPATGTDPRITFTTGNEWFPYSQEGDSSTVQQAYNFGQQGFAYTPPSGFLALSSENLPPNVPSTVRPQRYFDNLLYTGTGSSNIVEGLEFSPDMIWVKGRDTNGTEHMIIDSVRGGDASLVPSSTDTESTHGGRSMTFYPGGVRWNSDSNTCNANGENYILWCWKGGGSSSTFNIDGKGYTTAAAAGLDGGSLNPTGASINTKSGFSILTYTGTNSVSETIAHGLGKKPAWIIVKSRNVDGQDWIMYHKKLDGGNQPATHILKLNVSNTEADINDVWQDTEPTSSVFTIGTEAMVNHQAGHLYVAYCWSEIPGFSKFGSYEADGLSDWPYIRCGFRPALILIKNTSLAQPWVLMDNKINPSNLADTRLSTSNNNGDHTSGDNYIDFLADGFKIRSGSSTDINYSTSYTNHIFMAFAEQPGEIPFDTFANAR